LYSALVRGIDKVRLIAVWDGKNEQSKDLDARLVKHMIDLMRDTGGMVEQINPFKLSVEPVALPQSTDTTVEDTVRNVKVKATPSAKPKTNKKK